MFEDDRAYFQRRAERETELAEKASIPSVVQAHYHLAQAYLARLESPASAEKRS